MIIIASQDWESLGTGLEKVRKRLDLFKTPLMSFANSLSAPLLTAPLARVVF